MQPTINVHSIYDLHMTPIHEYPPSGDRKETLWSRTLVLTDNAGRSFRIGLFSDIPQGLVLDGEVVPMTTEQMQVAEPCTAF